MSALAFITPDAGERALARTPMSAVAAAAGATTVTRDGWELAASFADPQTERRRLRETVAFADRSPMAKLEIQAEPRALAELVAQAGGGVELELGSAVRAADGTWWCPVTRTRVLALCEPGPAAGLRSAVASAASRADSTVTVCELTSALAGLSLVGPGAAELLARFCAIDVRPAVCPVAAFRPGSIARTPGYLLREGQHELLLLVGWALGQYLWEVVADAARVLGGGPVGAEALAANREPDDA